MMHAAGVHTPELHWHTPSPTFQALASISPIRSSFALPSVSVFLSLSSLSLSLILALSVVVASLLLEVFSRALIHRQCVDAAARTSLSFSFFLYFFPRVFSPGCSVDVIGKREDCLLVCELLVYRSESLEFVFDVVLLLVSRVQQHLQNFAAVYANSQPAEERNTLHRLSRDSTHLPLFIHPRCMHAQARNVSHHLSWRISPLFATRAPDRIDSAQRMEKISSSFHEGVKWIQDPPPSSQPVVSTLSSLHTSRVFSSTSRKTWHAPYKPSTYIPGSNTVHLP